MAVTTRGALPSSAVKAQYQKSMTDLIDEMRNSVIYWIRARFNARADEIVATDASPSVELKKELRSLLRQWDRRFDEFADNRAKWFAQRVNTSTTNQLFNALKDSGLTVKFRNSRRVNMIMQSLVAENVNLIRSIPQQFLTQVNTIVMQSVQNGRDMGFITTEIEDRYKVSRNRAITIARDQTNKATETVSRARCEEIGITEGIWMHRSGAKVPRSTHEAMSGKRFKLSEGLYDSAVGRNVKTGELINCHCTYKIVIPGLENSQ